MKRIVKKGRKSQGIRKKDRNGREKTKKEEHYDSRP